MSLHVPHVEVIASRGLRVTVREHLDRVAKSRPKPWPVGQSGIDFQSKARGGRGHDHPKPETVVANLEKVPATEVSADVPLAMRERPATQHAADAAGLVYPRGPIGGRRMMIVVPVIFDPLGDVSP